MPYRSIKKKLRKGQNVKKKRSVKKKRQKPRKKSIKKNKQKTRRKKSNVLGGKNCIAQKHAYDCVIACLAMYLNKSHKYIKDKYFMNRDFTNKGYGITKSEELNVLKLEGCNCKDISPELPNRKAIVTVPSLNYPNSYHAVFWDGITICDPNIANSKKKNSKTKIYSHEDFINEPYKQPIISSIE